jgi:hypothetical protein
MKISDLNEMIFEQMDYLFYDEQELMEYWILNVERTMKKNGTRGSFTKYCKENGFKKSSYSCIDYAIDSANEMLKKFKKNTKEYKNAILLKRRAVLAKTFKKISKKRRKK